MTAHDYMAPESIGRLQQRASVVGIVGLVACVHLLLPVWQSVRRPVFSVLSDCFHLCSRIVAWARIGSTDAAAPYRRALGHHDSQAA